MIMKEHIKSLPHHPKRVIIISLIIAILIGTFGYIKINQKPTNPYNLATPEISTSTNNNISQNQDLTLGFLSGGRIKSVLVKSGDKVKKGDILATIDAENVLGALTQAKATYSTAEANYQKVINGATLADIALSDTSVEISQTSLANNEGSLVLALNNSLSYAKNAVNNNTNIFFDNPTSENPTLLTSTVNFNNQELENDVANERALLNNMFSVWDNELTGINITSDLATISASTLAHLQAVAKYIDDLNSLFTLYSIQGGTNFQTAISLDQNNILNAKTSITNQITSVNNAVQIVSSAEKLLKQSQASLKQKTTTARPEDIAIAQAQVSNAYGTVQIAQAAYENTIITAPSDGTVVSVSITPGQIAIPNAPAIEFLGQTL